MVLGSSVATVVQLVPPSVDRCSVNPASPAELSVQPRFTAVSVKLLTASAVGASGSVSAVCVLLQADATPSNIARTR